ncbi:hypothetical protein SLEP1_g38121 [Rubroshorea leprosula]|uniref:Uncharacterized protein n=1 Tax=Rubroshorea leprosula TaxID=152421 RepID=A0AAV5KWX3_9ROSI|nr:hypothetical protein SLEP1_g38121 [Rubroshorea leprosula]
MARQACGLKILEDSHVSPLPGSVLTTTVPLTFFDILWLGSFLMQRLFFYEFPYPTLHFTQTILPNLKTSLSHTLQHFFPFAGHLVLPPRHQQPYILYKEGDSVNFVVVESMANFNHLVGNHGRTIEQFQQLHNFNHLGFPETHARFCRTQAWVHWNATLGVLPGFDGTLALGFHPTQAWVPAWVPWRASLSKEFYGIGGGIGKPDKNEKTMGPPSSPRTDPVGLRDSVEELVKFTLHSHINGTLEFDLGLSKDFCFSLLKDESSDPITDRLVWSRKSKQLEGITALAVLHILQEPLNLL